jgi:uncharacterized protein
MDQKLIRKELKIEGMTCTNCELRIENKLKKVQGIVEVKVSYSKASAMVTFDGNVTKLDNIIEVVEKLDYKVLNSMENKSQVNIKKPKKEDSFTMNQLLGIGIIILAGYLILKNTIGFNFIPAVTPNMGFGILFVVGMITSLHCIAMCGGINLSQCVSYKFEKSNNKLARLKPSMMYNAGRVVSYTIIGGLVGALGKVVSFSGTAKGTVAIISGLFMIIMGINMLNIFPWLRKFNPRIPKIFGNKVHNNNGKHGPFYVGLLNGLMPCGPLQAMQIYALGTGSFLAGAGSMLFFSLGTVPLMFGFGAVSSFLSGKFTHRMMKVSAILVMLLGIIMMNRGFNLSGFNFINNVAYAKTTTGNVAKIEGNVQVVTTTLDSGTYKPFTVQKGIPVKWIIKANASDINSCNGTVTIPKYGISKKLVPGDNIIDEFTPTEVGNITYTCWMGMVSSNIKVVADITKVTSSEVSATTSNSSSNNTSASAGGCCGSTPAGFVGGKIPTGNIGLAKIKDNEQEVTVTVNNNGYTPAVVVVQAGIKAKIKFNTEQLSACNSTVVFPDYSGQLDLHSEKETPLITPTTDFTFQCGMGMLHGYVKVVKDISKVNLDDIRKEIKNYKPSSSSNGGGCCGG